MNYRVDARIVVVLLATAVLLALSGNAKANQAEVIPAHVAPCGTPVSPTATPSPAAPRTSQTIQITSIARPAVHITAPTATPKARSIFDLIPWERPFQNK